MATTKAIVKEINLTLKPQELETILDALWDRVEDMETGNDDLSLRTIHVGRLPFYKVDKGLIGGLKLQLGSFMVDTSIKNKLKKYEQALLTN
mgnify:CR=1 FL=1